MDGGGELLDTMRQANRHLSRIARMPSTPPSLPQRSPKPPILPPPVCAGCAFQQQQVASLRKELSKVVDQVSVTNDFFTDTLKQFQANVKMNRETVEIERRHADDLQERLTVADSRLLQERERHKKTKIQMTELHKSRFLPYFGTCRGVDRFFDFCVMSALKKALTKRHKCQALLRKLCGLGDSDETTADGNSVDLDVAKIRPRKAIGQYVLSYRCGSRQEKETAYEQLRMESSKILGRDVVDRLLLDERSS